MSDLLVPSDSGFISGFIIPKDVGFSDGFDGFDELGASPSD